MSTASDDFDKRVHIDVNVGVDIDVYDGVLGVLERV